MITANTARDELRSRIETLRKDSARLESAGKELEAEACKRYAKARDCDALAYQYEAILDGAQSVGITFNADTGYDPEATSTRIRQAQENALLSAGMTSFDPT